MRAFRVLVCWGIGVAVVHAGILAGWDVAGVRVDLGQGVSNSPPYRMVQSTSDYMQVQASLSLGDGVNPSTSSNRYGFKISEAMQTNSLAGALQGNHYLELSVEVAEGYQMNLSHLELIGSGSSKACSNVVVMSSVAGFVEGQELASSATANRDGGLDTDASGFGDVVDLRGSSYQGITGTVVFRLYAWGSSSGAATTYIRDLTGDDVALWGEVVPLGYVAPDIVAGWEVSGVELDAGAGVVTAAPPYTCYSTTSAFEHVTAYFQLGDGVSPSTSVDQYGFKVPGNSVTNSLAGAIAQQHYMECVLQVEEGYALNIESLEMNGQSTSAGCSNLAVLGSVSGYTPGAEVAVASEIAGITGGLDTSSTGWGGPIVLGDEYQDVRGVVSFRLYGWNSRSGSGVVCIREKSGLDFVVMGSVQPVDVPPVLPSLDLVYSNGLPRLRVGVGEHATGRYLLQCCSDLCGSNGWSSVTNSFSTDVDWAVSMTNQATFFRVIAE